MSSKFNNHPFPFVTSKAMPFKSRFTERFDIDPSIAIAFPCSPIKLSIIDPLNSTTESNSNVNSHTTSDSNLRTASIDSQPNPHKRPFQQNDKRHDALANKFKHFLNTIKRKERTWTVATPLARAVSTKY